MVPRKSAALDAETARNEHCESYRQSMLHTDILLHTIFLTWRTSIMTSNTRPKDMRTWIEELEEAGELIRIAKPVDPLTQMGSLLYQSREKALFFENLPHGWRSLGQAPANIRHAALAFGAT